MLRLEIGHWEVGETIGRTHIRTDTHRLGNYYIDMFLRIITTVCRITLTKVRSKKKMHNISSRGKGIKDLLVRKEGVRG